MNWHKILYVDPASIEYTFNNTFDILEERRIEGGDWDTDVYPFAITDICKSVYMLIDGVKWEETPLFSFIMTKLQMGEIWWNCKSEKDVIARGDYIMKLYESIKTNGIIVQNEFSGQIFNPNGNFDDEIITAIDRHGNFLFYNNGSHRLAIAKKLGLKTVPVKVYRRHNDWEKTKNDIIDFCEKEWGGKGKVYHSLPHPDFDELVPLRSDERVQMIIDKIPENCNNVLDIGSLFGSICYLLEKEGYNCTAVESDTRFVEIMNTLKKAGNLKFKVLPQSFFSLEKRDYDVIVAFNIFHHFLKEEHLFEQLKSFLNTLKFKVMFVQVHNHSENQMKGAFINFTPDEFASFLKTETGKIDAIVVGEENSRIIYRLS